MTPTHRDVHSDRDDSPASDCAAYALGALTTAEAEAVEQYIESDDVAARELDAMLDTVTVLSMSIGDAQPDEALRARILEAAEAETIERRKHASFSLLSHIESEIAGRGRTAEESNETWYKKLFNSVTTSKLAFATSIAAFLVAAIVAIQVGADNVNLNRRIAEMDLSVQASTDYTDMVLRELDDARQSLNAAEVRMQQQATQIETMSASNDALRESFNDQISLTYATLQQQYRTPDWLPDSSAYSSGYMYLLESRFDSEAALVIGGVAPAPPGEEYRLYLVAGDDAQHAASFNMNQAGYGTVIFGLPAPLSTFDGAHITRERILDPPDPTLAQPANRYRPQ